MDAQVNCSYEDAVVEMRAIVDLVDANISPVTDTAAWDAEITALHRSDRDAAVPSSSHAEIQEVIDLSSASA